MGTAEMQEAGVMRISPAQPVRPVRPVRPHGSFRLNGFAQRGMDGGTSEYGAISLSSSRRRTDGRHIQKRVRSPFPNLFRRAARLPSARARSVLVIRPFPLYSGRTGRERGELCQITTANFGKSVRPEHFIPRSSRIRSREFFGLLE